MKKLLLGLMLNLFVNSIWAGEMPQEKKSRGTAAVDATYTDEVKSRNDGMERNETETRSKIEENPRNRAFVESFGQIYSKENDQERQEEKKFQKKLKAHEGNVQGAD
jgi:hypothetical protein